MVTRGFKEMLAEANAIIDTMPISIALTMVGEPDVVFVDVRGKEERAKYGAMPDALHAPRGFLEFIADPASEMHDEAFSSGKTLLLFCASGGRSALAAKTLHDMGIEKVAHIAGGFVAWRMADGPIEFADPITHRSV